MLQRALFHLLLAESYFTVLIHTYHVFFIPSSAKGQLGSFHVSASVNSAAMNIGVHVSFQIMFFFFWIYAREGGCWITGWEYLAFFKSETQGTERLSNLPQGQMLADFDRGWESLGNIGPGVWVWAQCDGRSVWEAGWV